MKKLILSAAIILGSFSAFAQQSTPPKPVATTQTAETVQTVKDTYTEIKLEEVPTAVKDALTKAYPTAILNKAFVNEKKEYELQVKVGEKEGSVYADAAGAWIKK
jgi:Skp family chaperone for outer membrane proteins